MKPVPTEVTAEAVQRLKARAAELASEMEQEAATKTNGLGTDGHETVGADAQAVTVTDGLSTAGHTTGGAEVPPVAHSEVVAMAATASTGCSRPPISEELYDAVYDLGRGTPALARMIVNEMLQDSAGVEELLRDDQLLRDAVDYAYTTIMDMPTFRTLRSRTFASVASEMAAIEARAADLLGKEMKADAANDHEIVSPSPSVKHEAQAPKRQKKKRNRRQRGSGASGSK